MQPGIDQTSTIWRYTARIAPPRNDLFAFVPFAFFFTSRLSFIKPIPAAALLRCKGHPSFFRGLSEVQLREHSLMQDANDQRCAAFVPAKKHHVLA